MNTIQQRARNTVLIDLKPFIMKVINLPNLLITLCVTQTWMYAQPRKAPSQPVTETFFGKQITAPYRNLDNLSDANVMTGMKRRHLMPMEYFNRNKIAN
jgi:hypothetical protein